MWNGSKASWAAPLRAGALNPSLQIAGVLVCLLALGTGCSQGLPKRNAGLSNGEGSPVSADRLFELGLHYARQGDLQRAEQYLSAARHHGYHEADVVPWLVRVCVVAGRYHSALEHGVQYLRKWPNDWALRFVIASIHEALGDLSRAQSELEAIVRTEPDRALPHYRLATIVSVQHRDPVVVRRHLQEYLRLAPHGVHALEVAAMLRTLADYEPGPDSVSPSGAVSPLAEANP